MGGVFIGFGVTLALACFAAMYVKAIISCMQDDRNEY